MESRDLILCLSGGGLRATFFHLGVVEYLRTAGALNRLAHVYSVSGGSILAAHLALSWPQYAHGNSSDANQKILAFGGSDVRGQVLEDLANLSFLRFIRHPIGTLREIERNRTDRLVAVYSAFYDSKPLSALISSDGPAFHLLTTSLTRGQVSEFDAAGLVHHTSGKSSRRVGKGDLFAVAKAVAASSAFPPLFHPITVVFGEVGATKQDLRLDAEYLSDGGVFDNRGLDVARQTALHMPTCILIVSDASARFDWEASAFWNVVERAMRSVEVLMNRVDSLLERMPKAKNVSVRTVSIHNSVRKATALPELVQHHLGALRTDLDAFRSEEMRALFQHGFAVAQHALAADLQPVTTHPIPDPLPTAPRVSDPKLLELLQRGSRVTPGTAVSRLKRRAIAALSLGGALLLGLVIGVTVLLARRPPQAAPPPPVVGPRPAPSLAPEAPLWVQQPISQDEVASAIGELFLIGLGDEYLEVAPQRTQVGDNLRALLAEHRVSGLLIRKQNIHEATMLLARSNATGARERVRVQITDAQTAGGGTDALPLLIAVDAEGGRAFGLPAPLLADAPSPMALGALRSARLVNEISFGIGTQLRQMGVNFNLAPVLDVNINRWNDLIGERSFGGHFTLVSALGGAAIQGYHRAGIAVTAKHYPGHGNTQRTRPDIATPPESSYSEADFVSALEPFRAAVRAGIDAIETSHFVVTKVRGDTVVTANEWYIRLLRQDSKDLMPIREVENPWVRPLGFRGPVVSDDLLSYWITGTKESEPRTDYVRRITKVCLDAIKAGHDLLILSAIREGAGRLRSRDGFHAEISNAEFTEIVRALQAEANRDPALMQRIQEAVGRNRALRARAGSRGAAAVDPSEPIDFGGLARNAYLSSFLWTQSYDGRIPEKLVTRGKVLVAHETAERDEGGDQSERLLQRLRIALGRGGADDPACSARCARGLKCALCSESFQLEPKATIPVAADRVLSRAEELDVSTIVVIIDSVREVQLLGYIVDALERKRSQRRQFSVVPVITAHPNLITVLEGPIHDKVLNSDGVLFAFSGQQEWAEQLAHVLLNGRSPRASSVSPCDGSKPELLRSDLPVVIPDFLGMPNWMLCDEAYRNDR